MLARETSQLLKKHQIRLDRREGQNYLVNDHILARIVESAGITTGDVVLEIGAGIGTLTIPLARKASKVFAILYLFYNSPFFHFLIISLYFSHCFLLKPI